MDTAAITDPFTILAAALERIAALEEHIQAADEAHYEEIEELKTRVQDLELAR